MIAYDSCIVHRACWRKQRIIVSFQIEGTIVSIIERFISRVTTGNYCGRKNLLRMLVVKNVEQTCLWKFITKTIGDFMMLN